MNRAEFEKLVGEIGYSSVPEPFRSKIMNVALLIEDEPSSEIATEAGLSSGETLLGYYRGIPQTERGDLYGVGITMPDTIHLFRLPILDEAAERGKPVEHVIRETIWHEVGHHFGLNEDEVMKREEEMGW